KGYRPYEFSGFCVPQEEATARFDEAIEVIRLAWTSKGRFSYDGKWWHYDNIVVEPAPIQQPHPPLWLGAGSAESIRRAARERYNHIKDDPDAFELDDAPLLGTPEEIIARLKRLEAGGIQNVLFAAPGAAIAGLRTFAEEIMPAFEASPMVLAQV